MSYRTRSLLRHLRSEAGKCRMVGVCVKHVGYLLLAWVVEDLVECVELRRVSGMVNVVVGEAHR